MLEYQTATVIRPVGWYYYLQKNMKYYILNNIINFKYVWRSLIMCRELCANSDNYFREM